MASERSLPRPVAHGARRIAAALLFFLPIVAGCSSGLNRDVPPQLTGTALYRDANANGMLDAGDTLTVTFDQNIISLSGTAASSFQLPVAGDSLGTGATFAIGSSATQLIITLGASPAFTARLGFSSSDVDASSPSGIDISATIVAGAIVGEEGETAVASTPIDIVPAFTDSMQSFASLAARNIARGDFNGDGDDDIFLVAFGEGNRVLLDGGGGVFTDTAQSLGSAASLGAAVGDFDQDGDLDVAVANDAGATNQIWTNDGMGNFTAGPTFGTGQSRDVFAGDFDGDGRLDLAVANSGANTVWINQGGTFLDGGQSLGIASSRAVRAADFDVDGDLDLAFANDNAVGQIWRNNGSGTFISVADLTGPTVGTSIAVGDVDRDGFPDVVVGSLDRGLTTFVNSGPTSFTADPDFGGSSVRAVTLGDVDGDGDLDLIEGRSGSFSDRIWFNDGSGFFDDSGMRLGNLSTYGVTLTDLGPTAISTWSPPRSTAVPAST